MDFMYTPKPESLREDKYIQGTWYQVDFSIEMITKHNIYIYIFFFLCGICKTLAKLSLVEFLTTVSYYNNFHSILAFYKTKIEEMVTQKNTNGVWNGGSRVLEGRRRHRIGMGR